MDSHLFGGLRCFDHIGGVAARTDGKQHISFASYGLQVALEHMVIAIVIAHAAHVAHIRHGDSGNGRAVIAIPACQLLSKVHGVATGAAVATAQEFTAIFQ